MASLKRLDNLYQTMTDLAAYLMIAHERHARFILSQPDNRQQNNGSIGVETQVSLTYEYVQALLACGIPSELERVQEAVKWFGADFRGTLDKVELLRLEALLYLNPAHAGVRPRLVGLLQHRLDNGLFEIEGSVLSDTLLALRALLLARERNVLDGRISDSEIEQAIDKIRDMLSEDSGLALLLRLKHRLTGQMDDDLLKRLLTQAREHDGVWGMGRKYVTSNKYISSRMKNIIQAMHRQQLSSAVIGDQAGALSEIMLNTCAVIEQLAEVADGHKAVRDALETSMALWWNQLQGDQAPGRLRDLFPDELTFLRVLCRTVIAVRAYTSEPLCNYLLAHALGAAASRFKEAEWAERADIEAALRWWIGVDIPENPVKLKLGLSDSNVVRIAPRLYHRLTGREMNLPGESLIVKYGPIDEVDEERANYNALSQTMQRFFVEIPDSSYISESRQAFVIMEDLVGYFTLYEIYKDLLVHDDSQLSAQLGDFLINMHSSEGSSGVATSVHFHDLYIRPMLEQVDFIFARVQELERSGLMPPDYTFDHHEVIHDNLSDLLATILQRQRVIERFPTAFMHGDLHSRNIMIRWNRNARRSQDHFEFKLIDLSNLRPDGDIAHDAGQLLVDLETLNLREDFNDPQVAERLDDLMRKLEYHYSHYAYEYARDSTFSIRLNLARARALIRIAKSRAKQGGKHLRLQAHREAVKHIGEGLHFAQGAADYLEAICQEIIP